MPTLKTLLACERVIFDQDGPVSLISIFQKMKIQLSGVPLPEKAISPTQWCVFALWEVDASEVGKEFTQIVRVVAPDGVVFLEEEAVLKNDVLDDSQLKVKMVIAGLPIWKDGWVSVKSWLKGYEDTASEYRFEVVYLPPPPAPQPVP